MIDKKKKQEEIRSEIDKKVEEKIDRILEEGLGPEFDQIVEKKVKGKLQEKVLKDVNSKVEEKTLEVVPEEEKEKPKPAEPLTPAARIWTEFRTNFHLCWRGSCRIISLIIVPVYVAILSILLICRFSQHCAPEHSTVSVLILYLIIVMVVISLFFSIFSKYPRTALIFWILMDIPVIIAILFFTAKYIALGIISLILVLRIVQTAKSQY